MIKNTILSLGKIAWSHHRLQPVAPGKKGASLTPVSFKKALAPVAAPTKIKSIHLNSRPLLQIPRQPTSTSFRPSRYFSKGKRSNRSPFNWQLLSESLEKAIPRSIPHNFSLIRSLCKGSGELKKNELGFVFLDIDNRFIQDLCPYFQAQGLIPPPYFNLFGVLEGAHIPVIPQREADFNFLSCYKELGTEFLFEVEGLYSVTPEGWPEMEEVWFLNVYSPELEDFRRRYFLPPLPGGHSFHIVVAIKPRQENALVPSPTPFLRINPAFIPV